jgi:hypothetical protein
MGHKGSRTLFLALVAATCAGAAFDRANAAPAAGGAGAGSPAAPPSTPPRAWKPLRSASASATSFLQNNWNRFEENYHPSYVLDENPATAWVEGAAGFGEDESITIPLSAVRVARAIRLRIWNGYQKSMNLWTKNAMPNRVRITVFDPRGAKVASPERELARQLGPQEVVVELPPGSGVGSVRLTILSVYEGQKFDDTCVSDILVDVDSDVKHNAAAENAKLAALKQWVGTRKATAAYFASKPVEFPFAFTKFVQAKREVDRGDFKKRFAMREETVKTLGADRFKAGAKGAVRAYPDGLADSDLHLEDFGDLLRADRVALLATTEPIATMRVAQEGMQKVWTSSARVARDDAKNVRVIGFDIKDVTTERTSSTLNRELLLVYDGQGRLSTVYRRFTSMDEQEGDDEDEDGSYEEAVKTDEIWTLTYDAAGKIQSLERTSFARHHLLFPKKKRRKVVEDKRATQVVYTGIADKSS